MSGIWCILLLGGWLAWSGGAAGPGAVIRIDLGTIDHGECSATLASTRGHESVGLCRQAGSGAVPASRWEAAFGCGTARVPERIPGCRASPGAALHPQQEPHPRGLRVPCGTLRAGPPGCDAPPWAVSPAWAALGWDPGHAPTVSYLQLPRLGSTRLPSSGHHPGTAKVADNPNLQPLKRPDGACVCWNGNMSIMMFCRVRW